MAYALGRRVEYFDEPAIRAIAKAAEAAERAENKFSALSAISAVTSETDSKLYVFSFESLHPLPLS